MAHEGRARASRRRCGVAEGAGGAGRGGVGGIQRLQGDLGHTIALGLGWRRPCGPGGPRARGGAFGRLSFRRLVGLALADPAPDHSTLSRLRSGLSRRGLAERLLAELNRQLDARGLTVKTGTLIDASLVAADCRRPRKGEPVAGRSDRDASWNAMPERPLFGDKMQLAVTRARAWCAGRSSRPATSRTRRRSSTWSRATSGRCTPIAATTAGGTAKSCRRGIADGVMAGDYRQSGRSMPPGTPATGRSGPFGHRSSAPSRSSSAGTAAAGCAIAVW